MNEEFTIEQGRAMMEPIDRLCQQLAELITATFQSYERTPVMPAAINALTRLQECNFWAGNAVAVVQAMSDRAVEAVARLMTEDDGSGGGSGGSGGMVKFPGPPEG